MDALPARGFKLLSHTHLGLLQAGPGPVAVPTSQEPRGPGLKQRERERNGDRETDREARTDRQKQRDSLHTSGPGPQDPAHRPQTFSSLHLAMPTHAGHSRHLQPPGQALLCPWPGLRPHLHCGSGRHRDEVWQGGAPGRAAVPVALGSGKGCHEPPARGGQAGVGSGPRSPQPGEGVRAATQVCSRSPQALLPLLRSAPSNFSQSPGWPGWSAERGLGTRQTG